MRLDDSDQVEIEHVVEGDSVEEVLGYVQFSRPELVEKARRTIEVALRAGHITMEESARLRRRYDEGLSGYTYLDVKEESATRALLGAKAAS